MGLADPEKRLPDEELTKYTKTGIFPSNCGVKYTNMTPGLISITVLIKGANGTLNIVDVEVVVVVEIVKVVADVLTVIKATKLLVLDGTEV